KLTLMFVMNFSRVNCIDYPDFLFFLLLLPPTSSTLFPYTTLFRSDWSPPPPGNRSATVCPHRRHCRSARSRRAASPVRRRSPGRDRKSTRLNSSHDQISYAVFCLKKKTLPNRSTVSG